MADFGLSSLLPSMPDKSPEKNNSRYYMAPELISSHEENYNEKVDIWSLGCLVYYVLSGKHAFSEDESIAGLNQKILNE